MERNTNIVTAPMGVRRPDWSEPTVIQSKVITNASYDFDRMEMQLFLVLIAAVKKDVMKMFGVQREETGLLIPEYQDDIVVTVSLNDFKEEMKDNEKRLIGAAESLIKNTVGIKTERGWSVQPLVSKVEYVRRGRMLMLRIRPEVWKILMNVIPGYTEYDVDCALHLKSVYSIRFYMFVNTDGKKPVTFSVQELRKMFRLEKKYKTTGELIKKVVKTAQKELDERSPLSFDDVYTKRDGSKEIMSITLVPRPTGRGKGKKGKKKDEDRLAVKRIGVGMVLSPDEAGWLTGTMGFTERELQSAVPLLLKAKKSFGSALTGKMKEIFDYMQKHPSPRKNNKGYFLKSLENRVNEAAGVQGDLFEK